MDNPFPKNIVSYRDFEILKDGKWHCANCELNVGQAKTWQTWREKYGIKFASNAKDGFYSKIYCDSKCKRKTSHRKIMI